MKKIEKFLEFELPLAISEEEINIYFEKYKLGDLAARDLLITGNMRLVSYVVLSKFNHTAYEMKELFSVGLLGLIKSVDSFDKAKGIKFATYATTCITNEILMFFRREKKYTNIVRLEDSLSVDYEGHELRFEDVLEDQKADFVSDYLNNELYLKIRELVEQMPERDRTIIKLYFGFDGEIFTQREIAAKLGITQSYLSRIINKLVKKIGGQLKNVKLFEMPEVTKTGKKNSVKEFSKSSVMKSLDNLDKVIVSKRKVKSIYQYFGDYTRGQIDEMLAKLSVDEKKLLMLRYGADLDHPVTTLEWSKEYSKQFYGRLVPKMRNLLACSKTCYEESLKQHEEVLQVDVMKSVDYGISDKCYQNKQLVAELEKEVVVVETNLSDKKPKIDFELVKGELVKLASSSNEKLSLNLNCNEDYLWVLDLFKPTDLSKIMARYSLQEIMIIVLKLGYVNGQFYETQDISKFLCVPAEMVREITTNFLRECKENINKSIDEIIAYTTTQSVLKKKKVD